MMGGMALLATQTPCQSEGVAPACKNMWLSSPSSPWFGHCNLPMLELELPFTMGALIYDWRNGPARESNSLPK